MLKIEDYLESLPSSTLTGEEVTLPEKSLREIFKMVRLDDSDTLYHLGCGDETGIAIAMQEFGVKKAVGIDNNPEKISAARTAMAKTNLPGRFMCNDIRDCDISDATVILFWFTDLKVVDAMIDRFSTLKPGTKIVTLWGPLLGYLPSRVEFPYVVNEIPFEEARSMSEQIQAVLGVKCIDFVTAWEFAERYIKSVSDPKVQNDRFLTIIMTLTIWINARNMQVACEKDIPESIQTYINIMREHFGIEFGHLLEGEF